MFRLNFKITLRNLWKNKGYTLINVGGLAIGLASCMVLLLYVAYEWSYDKQSKNYADTYVVYQHQVTSSGMMSWAWTPGVLAPELSGTIPGAVMASHSSYPQPQLLSFHESYFKKAAVYGDPQFLKIMDYKFLKGNPARALREVNSVILTETLAKNLFGNEDPINKIVKLNNKEDLKVDAVIADIPKNSSIEFDYLLPWSLWERQQPFVKESGWGNNFCLTLVQLQKGENFSKADELLSHVLANHQQGATGHYSLHTLSKWHLYSEFQNGRSVGGKIDQVRIFFMLAFCILLIACVNFMNLSTARSEKRAKEVGVRKAIGSSRKSLISQFMLESVLLSVLGMVVAFVLIEISLPYFNGVLHTELVIHYSDWKFWGVFAGLTIVTGCIAGSYPAFYLSSFEPLQVLKGVKTTGSTSLSVRQVLVVFQFVFAACLIICTAVIYQQLNFIKNKSIGYNKNNLVEIPIQGSMHNEQKLILLKDQLLKSGALSDVTFFSRSISEGGNNTFDVNWQGKNPKENVLFNHRSAGYDFAKTMGSGIINGREFSPKYTDTANVIINEAAVKIMGLKNPVGTVIKFWNSPVTIIGVMKDFVMENPYSQTAPLILYHKMNEVEVVVARLNAGTNISSSMDKIKEVTERLNPGFPVDTKFVDDNFEQKFQNEKLLGTVANWFGGFAIFISCLGLLGLALYMAEQRKKEISIRKVLGASNMNIVTLLNKDFIKLVIIADLIAFPIAYLIINHWLSTYSFRVSISVLPFAIALGLSLIIAILTVSVQSVKVAKANPVDALKYE
ncbi:ABC transporter permease [Pedobacter hartonius]|uniref:ABC-type antimicrobial peptide transport system, permease component n=1 Tax=Pedobacter hartonius TaxID=425514 RepID=A0A1H4GGM0_9SPHI|nr:ABC transporter permease [Pedobacter hartonius]SEB08775.1 ABC-type antimicrobial peptide transport system, permease component [Pedobacter hartonius]